MNKMASKETKDTTWHLQPRLSGLCLRNPSQPKLWKLSDRKIVELISYASDYANISIAKATKKWIGQERTKTRIFNHSRASRHNSHSKTSMSRSPRAFRHHNYFRTRISRNPRAFRHCTHFKTRMSSSQRASRHHSYYRTRTSSSPRASKHYSYFRVRLLPRSIALKQCKNIRMRISRRTKTAINYQIPNTRPLLCTT